MRMAPGAFSVFKGDDLWIEKKSPDCKMSKNECMLNF